MHVRVLNSLVYLGLPAQHTPQTYTVCNISCDHGYTRNITNCSCEFTDGCEAAGQPCQNGGKCVSDLLVPPYYSCQCGAERTGQNCESECVYACVFAYIYQFSMFHKQTQYAIFPVILATPGTPLIVVVHSLMGVRLQVNHVIMEELV